jgi:Uncharacterised protein family (UPF0158)
VADRPADWSGRDLESRHRHRRADTGRLRGTRPGLHRPNPSLVWYQDMADFAEAITDDRAGRRLLRAIQGRGAVRRFKDELHEEYPELVPVWYAFRDARATRRAVQWLADNSLISNEAADLFLTSDPDPDLPCGGLRTGMRTCCGSTAASACC